MKHSDSTNRRGFTLVEMLVVISVIVILLLIAVPSMFQVTEHSRRATCLSNAKQCWVATMAYRKDFNQLYPLSHYQSLRGDSEGPSAYRRNANEIPGNPNPSLLQDSHQVNPLNAYLGHQPLSKKRKGLNKETHADIIKNLVCPSNDWMVRDEKNPSDGTFYRLDENGVLNKNLGLYHFLEYNYEMTYTWWSRGFRKPKNPAQTLLFYDQEDSGSSNLNLFEGNHRDVSNIFSKDDGGVNMFYCDGNGRWFTNRQPYKHKGYVDYTGQRDHPYQLVRDEHGWPIRDENGRIIKHYRYGDYEGVPY